MAYHPLNLALRLLLELAALGSAGFYGWKLTESPWRSVTAIALPLIIAVVWGTFAVPGDPSRSGDALVPVAGVLRLAMELAIFGFAVWALYSTRPVSWSLALGSLVTVHYLLSCDRIAWLLSSH